MCHTYLTIYPCNHAVLTAFAKCAPGARPFACPPQNLETEITTFEAKASGLPPTCPGGNKGRPCLSLPLEPTEFGPFCVRNKISIIDAVAMAPVWVFDLRGHKIGTRTQPWRLSDYIVAWYTAKNPTAVANRFRLAKELDSTSKKRKAEDGDVSGSRKVLKVEASDELNAAASGVANLVDIKLRVVKVES